MSPRYNVSEIPLILKPDDLTLNPLFSASNRFVPHLSVEEFLTWNLLP